MIWKVKSFGDLDLNSSAGYYAFLDDKDNPSVQPTVELETVETGSSAPVDAGMIRKEDFLIITVVIQGSSSKRDKYNALIQAFDSLRDVSQRLVCLDSDGSEWFVMGRVAHHTMKAMVSKITLLVADSVWRNVSEQDAEWEVSVSGQTQDIEVGGTVEALPIIDVTIDEPKTGGFGYRRWCRVYNPNAEAVVNEAVEITNGGLDTAAMVTAGKCQADGDDIRIYDNGQEVERWLVEMNDIDTRIFAGPFYFSAKIELSLSGSIADTGSVTAVFVKNTATNKTMLERLPNQRGIIEIDSERFIFTGRDTKALRIDIAERAVRKSSAAAHADGATIKWIEHDVWLYYGNSSLDAPEVDDTHEPAYDMATSSNGTRVYTSFGDKARLRPGSWQTAVLKGLYAVIYSGNHGDETADPMTELGMAVKAFLKSGKWTAETALLECRLSHPGEIASVTATGEKRLASTSGTPRWPTVMALQKSKDGKAYANQFNELIPSPINSWVTIANTGLQNLGAGFKHIRFVASGAVAAVPDCEADLEIDSVTVVVTNPIAAALQDEENNYDLDCEIQNVTTGQSIYLKWTMGIGDTLTADSEARKVTHSDGTNAFRARRLDNARLEWLPLRPGTNQLKFIDLGTVGVTVRVRYTERRKR